MVTKRWYQDWLGWMIVGSITYGLICLLSLASDVGQPFPNFLTYYSVFDARMDMQWNTPSWWWDTTNERPQISDILLQVDDTSFADITSPVQESVLYQTAWDQGKTVVNVTVERAGELKIFSVPLEIFTWSHYGDLMLMPVIVAACYWLLTIILYRTSESDVKQRIVVLVLCAFALLGVAIQGALFIFGSWRENILLFINPLHSITATLIGALLIHLALTFPFTRWPNLLRWLMPFIYAVAILSYSFFFSSKVMVWLLGTTPTAQWLDGVWYQSFQYLIIIGVICVLLRMLGEAIILPSKSRERAEARVMLLAFCLLIPVVWFAIHGVSSTNATILFLQPLADTRYLSLVVPFAFAAISLRYHTFSGAESWLFLALALAVSGFLANIGTAIIFRQIPNTIRELPVPPTAVLFVLFLLISLLSGWQSSWRGWLGRIFHWERVNYNIVRQVGQQLLDLGVYQETEVTQALANTLTDTLEVERTAVWVLDAGQLTLAAQAGHWPTAPPTTLPLPPDGTTKPLNNLAVNAKWPNLLLVQLTAVVPLTTASQMLAIIAVGPRWDTAVFDDRDLEILALIGQQATLFLQNSRQSARLRANDQQLLAALTHAQQKTAQDLHDHLLPTLSRTQFNLLNMANLIEQQPELAQQSIHDSQQALAASTELVRRIQQGLVVRPLQYGLRTYLVDSVERFRQDSGLSVKQTLPADLDIRLQALPLRQALYAIWQQSLDNIQQHAQATHVTISLTLTETTGSFSICDNGRGSSAIERQQAQVNGRFGLRSMQIRIEAVDGQLQFDSTPGQGSCVRGEFPLISQYSNGNRS